MFPPTDIVKYTVDIFPFTDSSNDIHSILSIHVPSSSVDRADLEHFICSLRLGLRNYDLRGEEISQNKYPGKVSSWCRKNYL